MSYVRETLLLQAVIAILTALPVRSENWPCWRGPRGDGTSHEENIPTKWSSTENIAWKTPIPGSGYSSPIIWGDRIFLTTAIIETQERVLISLNRKAGRVLWQQTVLKAPLEDKHSENGYASSTPATDGEKVYVSFLEGSNVVVAAHDFSGKQIWITRPGGFSSQWGFAHTPVLFDDKVILDCDSKGENFIIALSRVDGRTLWKVQRDNPSQSYSVPFIREMAGRMQMIVAGNNAVTSYDPRDGRQLWVVDGPSRNFVASPVYNTEAGLVLISSSYPARVLMGIGPDGEGNVTKTKVVWSTREGTPYVPSLITAGRYFMTSSFEHRKSLYCFEAASGKVVWRQENLGLHHASPVMANGLMYFLNDDGVMHIVKAGSKFKLVARNELGENTYASPAISQGQIFLRGFKNLYCISQTD